MHVYPRELEIKEKTEGDSFTSYLNILLSLGM